MYLGTAIVSAQHPSDVRSIHLIAVTVAHGDAIGERKHLVRLESGHTREQQSARGSVIRRRASLLEQREGPNRILEEEQLRPGENDAPRFPLPAAFFAILIRIVYSSALVGGRETHPCAIIDQSWSFSASSLHLSHSSTSLGGMRAALQSNSSVERAG